MPYIFISFDLARFMWSVGAMFFGTPRTRPTLLRISYDTLVYSMNIKKHHLEKPSVSICYIHHTLL